MVKDNCKYFREQMDNSGKAPLFEYDNTALNKHVSTCPECKKYHEAYVQLNGIIDQYRSTEFMFDSKTVTKNVMATIENKEETKPVFLLKTLFTEMYNIFTSPLSRAGLSIATLALVLFFAYQQYQISNEIKALQKNYENQINAPKNLSVSEYTRLKLLKEASFSTSKSFTQIDSLNIDEMKALLNEMQKLKIENTFLKELLKQSFPYEIVSEQEEKDSSHNQRKL